MNPRRLLVDPNTALHAIHMATEGMGEPASCTAHSVQVSKTVGLLRKKTETRELVIRDGRLYLEADSDAFEDWAVKVMDALPPGIIDDHGIPAAQRELGTANRLTLNARIRDLPKVLRDGEKVNHFHEVQYNFGTYLLAVTNERILLRAIGLPTGGKSIDIGEIITPRTSSIVGFEVVTIETSAGKIRISSNVPGVGDRIQAALKELRSQQYESSSEETVSAPPLGLDDLTKLAELREAGILTDEEYAAGKAKILGL